jgi:dolichol-phosphate mannosyltransferase
MKTAVIIPTYNESDNIASLVEEIIGLEIGAQVIIVDDNSPDGTGDIADELAERYQEVHIIHRPSKMGLGTAHIAGFKLAFTLGAEYILTMDADFSHHPRYIPHLVDGANTYHLVIGSRYVDGGGTEGCDFKRRLFSRLANAFARLVLGLQAHDCTAGFRCYRRQTLESIALDQIFSNGYSFLIEMLYKCQRLDHRVGEVPIVFHNRQRGASKISRQEIVKAAYTVLHLGWGRIHASLSSR